MHEALLPCLQDSRERNEEGDGGGRTTLKIADRARGGFADASERCWLGYIAYMGERPLLMGMCALGVGGLPSTTR